MERTTMSDADAKAVAPDGAPREFPVTVTVDDRVRVTVVLLLKAGTKVAVKETKVETEPPAS